MGDRVGVGDHVGVGEERANPCVDRGHSPQRRPDRPQRSQVIASTSRWSQASVASSTRRRRATFPMNGRTSRITGSRVGERLRKFRDDADEWPLLAGRAIAFIGRFYAEEAEARTRGLVGSELLACRRRQIAPLAAEFRTWIDEHLTDLLPPNPVRKAMQYYVNHWDALTRFLHDPAAELDNNWSERQLRKVCLIRNNSLYAGGEDGALRLCTLLTLIRTCRLLGVDPYGYRELRSEPLPGLLT